MKAEATYKGANGGVGYARVTNCAHFNPQPFGGPLTTNIRIYTVISLARRRDAADAGPPKFIPS